MTKEQILKKAIEKAGKNGYMPPKTWETESFKITFANPFEIIFSHDFAKAFWGEEIRAGSDIKEPICFDHLRRMVLEKEPLNYIKKFL